MNTLPVAFLTQSIVELLVEAYVGPPDAKSPTWFNDNDPNAGIFSQIDPLSAAEASKSADGTGNRGTTVASHTEHLRWSLANVNATLRGEPYQSNWSESWTVVGIGEEEWDRLRRELHAEFEALCVAIPKQEALENEYLNGLIALIPHAAYHLATIRQMIERVRA